MNFTDMKLYAINSATLMISFTNLEMWLKIKKLNKEK